MNVNLTPNITGKNVNIIKGATQADLTNSVNNSKTYRDEAEAFSIVSEAKSVEASYSALNASISATTAIDKAIIATTKANEANNSAINASASEAVCIAKATITTDKANIATAQSVIATDKANEASVSANTATTQAGIATTKASEASISASNALTSENNADTSEANALTYRNQAESFANSINSSNLVHISGTETITGDKTFTGTVSGLTKATVGLNNVDNTSDSAKNVLYATTAGTASANDVYAWAKASVKPTYTASEVGLGNVTNESKATMFTNSTLTGIVTLPSTTSIGTISSTELGYIDGVTSNIQTQLDSKNPNLVSGTNIKTINGSTILESGNINLVDLTTNQSISGIKTFSSSPIVPTPTIGTQVVNKDYVDDVINTARFFAKPSSGALFIKVSPSSIKIPAGFKYTSGANSYKLVTDYTLTLASNLVGSTKTAGTDYFVYAKSDGTFYISASDAITTDRLIGGFHYGLVGETETVTGNKTEAMMIEQRGIWSHSCWDLKFRPSANVRGKNFAHGIWVDIYLADEDIAIRGYSSPWKSAGVKAKIAAGTTEYGRAIPKIPLAFGGNGTLTYGKFTWFQAAEIAASLKCFLIDYGKFPSLAYGILENVSSSTNGYETTAGAIEHYPNLTSRYMEQAAGVQWIWGADLANYPTDTVWAWKANTDGRGQIYSTDNSPTAVILGGNRGDGVNAGSRASVWNFYVWFSYWSFGCRFACDHLLLD